MVEFLSHDSRVCVIKYYIHTYIHTSIYNTENNALQNYIHIHTHTGCIKNTGTAKYLENLAF